jgi:hypothetical protein
LGLLLVALFLSAGAQVFCQTLAAVIALSAPGYLAWQRPADCLRTVLTGIGLFAGGGAALTGLLMIHFAHFAR